jgi:SSS family solute:Na+ symporter
MTSSDANAISAVVIRDILPRLWKGARSMSGRLELTAGRLSVFTFIALSMVIALAADSFGGVLGLIVLWFGALVGPIAIPMLLGMLPAFRRCGPSAAVVSWAGGLVVFVLVKYVLADTIAALGGDLQTTFTVAGPVLCALLLFIAVGYLRPSTDSHAHALVTALAYDADHHEPEPTDHTDAISTTTSSDASTPPGGGGGRA